MKTIIIGSIAIYMDKVEEKDWDRKFQHRWASLMLGLCGDVGEDDTTTNNNKNDTNNYTTTTTTKDNNINNDNATTNNGSQRTRSRKASCTS